MQLSTTRRNARAWLPGFFGVLQYRGDAELAAAARLIVVWTISPPPGVTATNVYTPPLPFGIPKRFFDFFLRVRWTNHP